jgi:hypothetical protein
VTKTCFLCKEELDLSSFKTPRSRFKIMGLNPPEGMGESDRVCSKCLNKIHNEEIKRIKISKISKKFNEISR